ncbi:MAG: hypothetical protein WC933_02780 [Candidatus Paceibacterota bacterium]|jgi:hypothetical protein
MEQKQKGYIRRNVVLLVETSVGSHWKSDKCDFVETKKVNGSDEEIYIVDLKTNNDLPNK